MVEAPGSAGSARRRPVLEVRGLTHRFGGIVALDKISLSVHEGEVRCIIGPNGAGKTTLINVVTGLIHPGAGSVCFEGRDICGFRASSVARMGIARTFQTPLVFPELSVEANVTIGLKRRVGGRSGDCDTVRDAVETLGLSHRLGARAEDLSHGEKRRLELAMVMATSPRLLLLDEPAAGLGIRETRDLAQLLRRLCSGRTLVVVEHDMSFVREIADYVSVLHQGAVLAEGTIEEMLHHERVREVYLGQAPS